MTFSPFGVSVFRRFLLFAGLEENKKALSVQKERRGSLWDKSFENCSFCGATHIGEKFALSSAHNHAPLPVTVEKSVAAYLDKMPFRCALGSPFGKAFDTALAPPAALWKRKASAYSSASLVYVKNYRRCLRRCQELWKIFCGMPAAFSVFCIEI